MAMQSKENLILASAALARNTPELWAMFLKAFSEDVDQLKENLINSPSCDLERLQGRAQQSSILLKSFANCKDEAEKILNARKAK